MAAAAVISVALETIRNFLEQEARFYLGIPSNVKAIQKELERMQAFLKDAKYPHADNQDRTRVSQVRELAYDIEDNLLMFLAARSPPISRNPIAKITYFFTKPRATYTIGCNIADIKRNISELTTSLPNPKSDRIVPPPERSSTALARDLRRTYSHQVEGDFVGLEKEIEAWVTDLVNEKEHRAIPICGMGGLGKTTIARKLYIDKKVRRHFVSFAWTCVSQKLDMRDVLEEILSKLLRVKREDIKKKTDDELVRELNQVQMDKKCLVVLDDVWSRKHWQCLRPAFPCSEKRGDSKLLLTTRNKDVADAVNPIYMCQPRYLDDMESWELLKTKAFPRTDDDDIGNAAVVIDPEKQELGEEMVKRCCGLPLAILVLGGILIKKRTHMDWETVKQNINRYLELGGGHGHSQKAITHVLAFSYHELPYQFKQCFLYLANFPENLDIDAEKLYQSWLADGIISQNERCKDETMMHVAERFLAELAQRGMVQVNLKETAGGFKSCRLHNLMRDVCISIAKEENFTKVIDFRHNNNNPWEMHSPTKTTRRVSFYLGKDCNFTCSDADHIRSAFFYANDYGGDFLKHLKCCLKRFRLLRVLQLQGFKDTGELPKAIGDFIYLRYLSLWNSQYRKLPLSLAKLIHLETLDLEVATLLKIPNILWKLRQLKHLYLPKKFQTHDGKKLRLGGLSALEMLVNFNTSLCNMEDLDTLANLRKLRALISDNLDDLPGIINYISFTQNDLERSYLFISCKQFYSDVEMNQLRALLGCHRLYKLSISGHIAELPTQHHFSKTIAKIEFKGSELVQDPMAILEKLPMLSGLTFCDSAYMGEKMTCSKNCFPQLLTLKLVGLPNLRTWTIEEGAMPKLTRLVIAQCNALESVPDGLRFLKALRRLNLRWMLDGFKNGLRHGEDKEGKDFYKVSHVAEIKVD